MNTGCIVSTVHENARPLTESDHDATVPKLETEPEAAAPIEKPQGMFAALWGLIRGTGGTQRSEDEERDSARGRRR